MKVLIIDILNYSRLSSNDNAFVKTDIWVMIDELLLDLELVIKEKQAKINVRDLPLMEINPGQMRQVFQNLISNAIKFSKRNVPPVIEIFCEESTISISLSGDQIPCCRIHIKDNGIGFDEKFSETIFNLFEKLHSKDDYDGSGIGLSIAKKIIEKHHGQIAVHSQVDVGSEFIITLPINQPRSA
jgi:two-component system, chemotaxis family, CheB/CheR fusion protein